MPVRTGTLSLEDLLAINDQSILDFGVNDMAAIIQRDLAAHNAIMRDMLTEIAEVSTDRIRRYGGVSDNRMIKVDEHGRGPTQKTRAGDTVGFPLERHQYAIGWTSLWFQLHTPADMAQQTIAAQKAHVRAVLFELKQALFNPTNYTFEDYMETNEELDVKRLVNGDSATIPPGPNGEVFDGATHTHYNGSAAFDEAAIDELVRDVQEHHEGEVRIVIAQADEDAMRGLAKFKPYVDARLIESEGDPRKKADNTRVNNRAIGIYGAAEVWVKPWGVPNYPFAYVPGAPKPVVMREREQGALRGLRVAAQLDTHPLHAEYMEADFGVGVWTRTNGVIVRTDNATYAAPTINY